MHHGDQLIALEVVGAVMQALPYLTRLSAPFSRSLSKNLSLNRGMATLGTLRLADGSPLFTWAEAPRTWRAALRGQDRGGGAGAVQAPGKGR